MSDYEEGSLEADIQSALRGGDETPTPAAAPEPAAPEPVEAPEAGSPQERARDDHGRFVKSDEPVIVQPQTPTLEAPEPIQPQLSPPASWKAAAKAKFATLDPEVQAEVLRREEEMNQGLAQSQTKAERANRLETVLAPHKDRLALSGVDEYQYLGALMKADEMLRGPQAMEGLAQVARMYGLQLPGPQQDAMGYAPAPQDPLIQQLQQQVQQLTTQLTGFQTAQEQALESEVAEEINAFKADPAHMYFENVRSDMKALIENGRAKTLQDAYDMACWADPDVRKILLAEQAKPPVVKAPTRPAGLSITGSPGPGGKTPGPTANQNATIEDDVQQALAELSGRV